MFAVWVYLAGVLREIHFDTSHSIGDTCDVQLYTLSITGNFCKFSLDIAVVYKFKTIKSVIWLFVHL